MKPAITISMGDPAGISPEIIAHTLEEISRCSRAVIFGHRPTLESILTSKQLQLIDRQDTPTPPTEGRIGFVQCGPDGPPIDHPGNPSAAAQYQALSRATDAVLKGGFSALVTAPVAKNAISTLLPNFSGHTEYLAERAGLLADDVTMMFVRDNLAVGLISTHIALKDVPAHVTPKRLTRTYQHLIKMLRLLHPDKTPRIAVAALNPHAGEGGLFGTEEERLIAPFCREIAQTGTAEVSGPMPVDALFRDALSGRYDGVLAMYHDQAMIPLKLAGIGEMVNVTMGLPFIRTSPDHGTAYDIARKGLADPAGFQTAFRLAVNMAQTG